jgi:polysaccharide biosynthesis/export protein
MNAKKIYCGVPVLAIALLGGLTVPAFLPLRAGAAEGAPSSQVYGGYLMGPGDQIEILIPGYQDFTGQKVILPDGTISLPVIGSVMASDRTPDQLARELTAKLQPILIDPAVTVSLSTLRPVVVNVAGEVQRPGSVQLRSLTTTTFKTSGSSVTSGLEGVPTLSSALTESGGVTRNADIRQVTLRRTLPGGETTTVTVNLWDAIWSDKQPEDLVLRAGDAIFVPKLPAGEQFDRRLMARSRLAPATVRVRVVGEVTRPGEIQISPDSSLSSAIAIAGGYTKEAKPKEVQLIRLNDKGQIDAQAIDLTKLSDTLQVQEGDVLVVPEKGRSSFLRVLGQVLSPFGSLLNILRGF